MIVIGEENFFDNVRKGDSADLALKKLTGRGF